VFLAWWTEYLKARRVEVNHELDLVRRLESLVLLGLCIELWFSVDACGVTSYGFWAGLRSPLGSSETERSVISEG